MQHRSTPIHRALALCLVPFTGTACLLADQAWLQLLTPGARCWSSLALVLVAGYALARLVDAARTRPQPPAATEPPGDARPGRAEDPELARLVRPAMLALEGPRPVGSPGVLCPVCKTPSPGRYAVAHSDACRLGPLAEALRELCPARLSGIPPRPVHTGEGGPEHALVQREPNLPGVPHP